MHRRPFFSLIAAAVAALVVFSGSNRAVADVILSFGQIGTANTITATNPTPTTTQIVGVDVPVIITGFQAGGAPFSAVFNLTANSIAAAFTSGSDLIQQFAGTFSFTAGPGTGGTNYLSGTFSDAVFGGGSGVTLQVASDQPGESVSFTSDVIPASLLAPPRSINFAFANVVPPVGLNLATYPAFTSSISGTASAGVVPEPSTMAIAAIGALGMIGYGIRRRKSA